MLTRFLYLFVPGQCEYGSDGSQRFSLYDKASPLDASSPWLGGETEAFVASCEGDLALLRCECRRIGDDVLHRRNQDRRSQPPQDYALSPNGRTITYGADGNGIGLYDWQSGSVRYLSFPSELHVQKSAVSDNARPSFSADGTKIVAVVPMPTETDRFTSKLRLVVFDVATGRGAALPVEGFIRTPVFRPDGKVILYADSSKLNLFDLETQSVRSVVPSGFFFNLAFIDRDTPSSS